TALTWAEPRISIDQSQIKLTDFLVGYHVDQSGTLTFEEVRTLPFGTTHNRTSLGTDAQVVWFRLKLDNTSGTDQRFFVHLPHAYHVKSVGIYEERDGRLVHSELLDLNQVNDSSLMYRGTAVY